MIFMFEYFSGTLSFTCIQGIQTKGIKKVATNVSMMMYFLYLNNYAKNMIIILPSVRGILYRKYIICDHHYKFFSQGTISRHMFCAHFTISVTIPSTAAILVP